MFPGMNSRQMKQAMKKMGMAQEELDVQTVIFKMGNKDLIIYHLINLSNYSNFKNSILLCIIKYKILEFYVFNDNYFNLINEIVSYNKFLNIKIKKI